MVGAETFRVWVAMGELERLLVQCTASITVVEAETSACRLRIQSDTSGSTDVQFIVKHYVCMLTTSQGLVRMVLK